MVTERIIQVTLSMIVRDNKFKTNRGWFRRMPRSIVMRIDTQIASSVERREFKLKKWDRYTGGGGD